MHPTALIADRFVLERLAGAGGMGTVYRAVDRLSGAPVALKIAKVDDGPLRARALAEADALAALDHPAIVRLVAHGLAPDGCPFLAMEWLDGEDLAHRLARAPLTTTEAVLLCARVADALASAHARGVVHRDLKPSNLFLPGGEAAQVKLVDFGIAHVPRVGLRLTATGALLGTPGYMAPEQASGAREIGPAVDLFALGAVLFECLAGRPAFSGASAMALLAKLLLEEPPRLDAVRADLAPALVDLVACLLSKQPEDRLDADGVAAALSVLLHEIEGSAAPVGAPPAPAITDDEQRLACVLLIRPAPAPTDAAERRPDSEADLDATLSVGKLPPLLSPERDALERLRAIVGPRGGRADGLANGGLVASWVDPGVPRDQAARAARAALLVHKRLPGAALALASGMTELRGALGPALERAATLLDAGEALADAVPIDDITAGLLDARFEIAPAGAGYRLFGERAPDEEEVRLLLGRTVPCVGRDRELRALLDLLDECVAEPVARAVLVTAPAGAGKSRLRQEFLRFARLRDDGEVWTASADELGAGSPFALLGGVLQRAAGAGVGDPLEQRHHRIQALVARHVAASHRARVAAFLGEIAAAPFPAAAHPAVAAARRDPAIMVEQVRRAWLDLIAAETAAHPVLLVLEDLHWGDAPSLQLVDAALAALPDRPFMVLALARPELHDRFPNLWAGRSAQEMPLHRLTRRAAAQLVRHALPDADDALTQRLIDRADGNAFYLEELIRAAASGRGDALPETVAAMVQARLEALSPDERRLLRAASAFGEVFWKSGALALLGGAERVTSLSERLDALVTREILVRRKDSRFPAEEELAFRHALLRDGAYAALTDANRSLAHRLAAAWLEQAGEADPLILAAHHERGDQPARAAACYCRTVERALAGNDPHGAIAHAEKALALGPDEAERPRALYAIARATSLAGRLAEAERWTDQVLEAVPRGSGMWCAAARMKFVLLTQRGAADLLPFGISAVEGVEATPDNAGPLVELLSALWLILGLVGEVRLGEPYYALAEAIVETLGESVDPSSLGMFLFYRASFRRSVVLSLEQGLCDAQQAMHFFQVAGDRLNEGFARFSLGVTLWYLGGFERSEAELRHETQRAAPGVHSGMISRAILAMPLAHRGALDDALREATRAMTEAQAAHDQLAEEGARFGRVYVLRLQGAYAAAEQELRAMIPMTRLMPGDVYAALAEVRLAAGDAAEALKLAREVGDAGARSSAPARLLTRAVEAEALLTMGEREAARALLAETRAEILAIAADIKDEALRASFLTRGPLSARLLQLAEAEGVGPATG